ncbi:MAG TPA: hypothetical protein PK007_06630, partial [Candidatus Kapabacteria bacterium]|nr:hypothetical protein [Candidatus Kapabacteria bacterium]
SSDSFPWMLEYEFSDLPNFEKIKKRLEEIGDYIKNNNIRVSYHPSQFNVLGSLDENVVNRTIKELDKHSELMDLMKLEQSTFYPINIHINNTKPNIIESSSRFCSNFDKLSNGTKLRLTVENDDSENKFSVSDLYENIFKTNYIEEKSKNPFLEQVAKLREKEMNRKRKAEELIAEKEELQRLFNKKDAIPKSLKLLPKEQLDVRIFYFYDGWTSWITNFFNSSFEKKYNKSKSELLSQCKLEYDEFLKESDKHFTNIYNLYQ